MKLDGMIARSLITELSSAADLELVKTGYPQQTC